MRLKRIFAAALAAITAVSVFSLCAFAQEKEETKVVLTTLERISIHSAYEFKYLGDGYGSYSGFDDEGNNITGTIHFEKDEYGNLTYTDVEAGIEIDPSGDPSSVNSEYTPVIKDGKGYLVDKDGNRVSDMIDEVSYVNTLDEDLYEFWVGFKEEIVFVSYKINTSAPAESEPISDGPAADEPINYSDGLVLAYADKGVIADGAVFSAKAVEADETRVTYDISFKAADGTTIQPGGMVTVKLPIPSQMANQNVYVFRAETDGAYTNMNARAEGGWVVFESDHFSKYVISTESTLSDKATDSSVSNSESTTSPDILVIVISITLGVIVIAGAVVAVIFFRKKK